MAVPFARDPDRADASPESEWDESDDASDGLSVMHKRAVGTVGYVAVCVARPDRICAGVGTLGEIRAGGEVGDRLTPDEAGRLCGHVLAAARLPIELRAASPAKSAVMVGGCRMTA